MTLCPKCHIDKDRCECPVDAQPIQEEAQFEIPNDCDAVTAADIAYRLADEIDPQMHSKAFQARIARIKRNAIFIMDKAMQCIREPYETEKQEDEDD